MKMGVSFGLQKKLVLYPALQYKVSCPLNGGNIRRLVLVPLEC